MIRYLAGLALFAAAALLAAPNASAQVTYEGCYVGAGTPVPSVGSYSVNDIAVAFVQPGVGPVIYYNPGVIASVTPATRRFFYFHECAHHVLGHTIGMVHPSMTEQQADCWAITNLVSSGSFSSYDLNAVQSELTAYASGDWTHLPGYQRAINLYACLGY